MDLNQSTRAIELLFKLQGNQKRKVSGQPVVAHSLTIFMILMEQTDDDSVLIAALLHGVLRDKEGYTYNNLRSDFGIRVAQIVEELSEYKGSHGREKETWKERKYRPLGGFSKMEISSQMIFLVSRAVNLTSLVNDYRCHGEIIWGKFNATEADIARYYNDFFIIVTESFKHPLVERYYQAYREANKLFSWEERFLNNS